MTLAHTLKYAGADPYEPEYDRLAYPIAEQLQQDTTYKRLAQVRWLVQQTAFGQIDSVAQEDTGPLDDAVVATEQCVDEYIAEWLGENAEWLHAETSATAQECLEAMWAYGINDSQVSDDVQERILDAAGVDA